jgi:hypothetical protein
LVPTRLISKFITGLDNFKTLQPNCNPDKTFWLFLMVLKAFDRESMFDLSLYKE